MMELTNYVPISGNISISPNDNQTLFLGVNSFSSSLIIEPPEPVCSKCNSASRTKILLNSDKGMVCTDCIHDKVHEPDPHCNINGHCMICLESDKEILQWKRFKKDMTMCFDCMFDAAIFIKASNCFNDDKSLMSKE